MDDSSWRGREHERRQNDNLLVAGEKLDRILELLFRMERRMSAVDDALVKLKDAVAGFTGRVQPALDTLTAANAALTANLQAQKDAEAAEDLTEADLAAQLVSLAAERDAALASAADAAAAIQAETDAINAVAAVPAPAADVPPADTAAPPV